MSSARKKSGRPKLTPSEKRTAPLYVRLTPSEHRAFKKLAYPEPDAYVARRIILRWMGQERERSKQNG